MKRRWLLFSLAILVVWAGVSFYFYTQHKLVIREYDLDKTLIIGDTKVIFKQVSFTNYSRRSHLGYDDIPWCYRVITYLPVKLQLPYAKTCYFYSRPYQVDPDGMLKVKGIIISPEPYKNDEPPLEKNIDINIYYGDNYTVSGSQQEWGSNVCLFSIFGDGVPNTVKKIKVVVTDKKTGNTRSQVIKPDWDTQIYYKRPQDFPFSPEETIRQIVMIINDKGINKSKIQPLILNSVQNHFPWQNLRHPYFKRGYKNEIACQGNYKGYQNVYSVELMFLTKDFNLDKIAASQKFYFVQQGNEWKLIDVSKLHRLGV